jgi:hypothetical protein
MGRMSHDLGMRSRVHPNYKTKYRVNNWSENDRALVQCGDITLWMRTRSQAAHTPRRATAAIELARGEHLERRGELGAAREAKQRALRLFQQQGARGNAECLADQLEAPV